jgi:riboflavin kinase/FMN adenylyltransferase
VSNRQKVELLEKAGIDATLMLRFDRELAAVTAEDFVRGLLVDTLHARIVFAGADFRFGAKAAGDIELLRSLGGELGFEVRMIDDVRAEGGEHRTSSTRIRELLEQGRVRDAAAALGRLHSIRSTVVHGDARGRDLGFPTANLAPEIEGFRPADGVYATWAVIDGVRYAAATSIGNNPTFDGVPEHRVEAYLIDQKLDLYGKEIELEFVDYVRPMNRFDSVDALVVQLGLDVDRIRGILGA